MYVQWLKYIILNRIALRCTSYYLLLLLLLLLVLVLIIVLAP
jgi:hypothetical protein